MATRMARVSLGVDANIRSGLAAGFHGNDCDRNGHGNHQQCLDDSESEASQATNSEVIAAARIDRKRSSQAICSHS
jgi:hypothetical protein